ncbi:Putative uncharacterized protein [Moritella viscosa]|uniref:Uncharacterized protein n=1 Tax=Moritella viscosa TaxID=80854 RepID=A0ABY1HIR7_9GAMM|nr:putative uncharacterized protein [Moritella viscosa]SGY95062.1 Putative uncharacterized protein [Moritella viscosa]SGZ00297.1 Putative uncharacterized protein [Moritella viscosa]SGZ00719.1 Putative uncharacterized protein [Moritella viscosa]SGZ06945.1 Putative uncharacterized protein [Moritella viscosa]
MSLARKQINFCWIGCSKLLGILTVGFLFDYNYLLYQKFWYLRYY